MKARAFAIVHSGFLTEAVVKMDDVSNYRWEDFSLGAEGSIPEQPGIHYKQGSGRKYVSVYVEDENGNVTYGGNRNCQSMKFEMALALAKGEC